MTSSNSMSRGFCSLDEDSEDFSFFKSKTFFRPTKNVMNEREEEKRLSAEEVKAKIEEYNSKVSDEGMVLKSDGSYTGFIRIHLRVQGLVTGFAAGDTDGGGRAGCTLCYLPSVVKKIHISSVNTVDEVIQGILRKFTVLDNPQEFALYRQTHKDGQDIFQKLPITEHLLYLLLEAGPEVTIVLKENEIGKVDEDTMVVGGSERVRDQEKSKQEERNEDLKATVSELERRIRQLEENDKDQEERVRKQEEKSRQLEEKSRQLERNDEDIKATVSELKKRFEELGNRSGARQSGRHFIDRHHTALIKRVSMVDAVLDLLLEWGVLTDEMCDNVRSHNTTQKQMRELLRLGSIRCSQNGKERLYEALKKEEPAIMKELENMQSSQ